MELWIFRLAVGLAVISAASLVAKTETYRGLGRIVGGFSWIAFSVFVHPLSKGEAFSLFGYSAGSLVLFFIGVGTVISGARKFKRRNLPQQ